MAELSSRRAMGVGVGQSGTPMGSTTSLACSAEWTLTTEHTPRLYVLIRSVYDGSDDHSTHCSRLSLLLYLCVALSAGSGEHGLTVHCAAARQRCGRTSPLRRDVGAPACNAADILACPRAVSSRFSLAPPQCRAAFTLPSMLRSSLPLRLLCSLRPLHLLSSPSSFSSSSLSITPPSTSATSPRRPSCSSSSSPPPPTSPSPLPNPSSVSLVRHPT